MKIMNSEFKVGLFVIICLAGLSYLTFSTGKVNIKKDGYNLYVSYNDVAGLGKKAPVMLNGLEVGKVDDIKISYDNDKTRIILKLWLDRSAKVRENPVVAIKTLGMMGEKFIQISSSEGSNFIQPNTLVDGKPYMDLDDLMEQVQTLSKDITGQVNKLLGSLNGTIEGNKDGIAQIVKNLEVSSKNMEEFTADVKAHPWKLLFKGKEKK
jgi:phospholipid/cholesterol/gamma-HCH transport system substrate-binding protein